MKPPQFNKEKEEEIPPTDSKKDSPSEEKNESPELEAAEKNISPEISEACSELIAKCTSPEIIDYVRGELDKKEKEINPSPESSEGSSVPKEFSDEGMPD